LTKPQSLRGSFLAAVAFAIAAFPALSQETAPAGALSLELNAMQPSAKGCRLTFVVTNGLAADISTAAFELALFNAEGVVDRLTVLEFRDLPAGKTKVSRFDLAGADCGKISRILINTATECAGKGVGAGDCMRGIRTSTKAGIAFGV
jgi:hypothetical protein